MTKLPDLRVLPSPIQEKLFFLCDLPSQATLAHTSSCFRPCWHKLRPETKTAASGRSYQTETTTCQQWHVPQLSRSAQELSEEITAEVWKRRVHRAPERFGTEVLHCSLRGHLGQKQLAFILQLPTPSVILLGKLMNQRVFEDVQWPDNVLEDGGAHEDVFLTFRLTCWRQIGLSDYQVEHLEAMFSCVPDCYASWAVKLDLWPACEPLFHCTLLPEWPMAMQWKIVHSIRCTPDASEIALNQLIQQVSREP